MPLQTRRQRYFILKFEDATWHYKLVPMPKRKITLNFRVKNQSYNCVFKDLSPLLSVAEFMEHHVSPLLQFPTADMILEYHQANHEEPRHSKWINISKDPGMLVSRAFACVPPS